MDTTLPAPGPRQSLYETEAEQRSRLRKKKLRNILQSTASHILIIAVGLFFLVPFIWMLEVPAPPKVKRERVLPSVDLLEGHTSESIAQEEIEHKKEVIENTLRQFGLEAKVVRVSQGPAVTQYGVEPGYIERPGVDGEVRRQKVRVAQISSLQNDLADWRWLRRRCALKRLCQGNRS